MRTAMDQPLANKNIAMEHIVQKTKEGSRNPF